MPRPKIRRKIRGTPLASYFKPAGIPLRILKESEISLAEFEAIRLVDLENNPQEETSKKMQISQPTLSRILKSARGKIAEAIVKGQAIKIKKR